MKRALVCGAGGFIGHHLVRRLKQEGYWVRGVDIKRPQFSASDADQFWLRDLRYEDGCRSVFTEIPSMFDEVYQLAAEMGGLGFLEKSECEILNDNTLINLHMLNTAVKCRVPRYFFSSSACVYPDMKVSEEDLSEEVAYPANPHNEYGWEKLYAERMLLAYARRYGFEARIARFENCYGPEGVYDGGREKAPAAICRKAAELGRSGAIEVWGDGTARRSYIYIDDLIEGVIQLMKSDLQGPVNIGGDQSVSVDELVYIVSQAIRFLLTPLHISGPVGVQARCFNHQRLSSLGWYPRVLLNEGIAITYSWICAHRLNATCGLTTL